jgi:dihydrofolate reductase
MGKLGVRCFSVSLDGFGAGANQGLQNPLGVGGMALHDWLFSTRTFQSVHGSGGGTTGIDDDFAARGFAGVGAWILGRNMFGPIRGRWPDEAWERMVGRQPKAGTGPPQGARRRIAATQAVSREIDNCAADRATLAIRRGQAKPGWGGAPPGLRLALAPLTDTIRAVGQGGS